MSAFQPTCPKCQGDMRSYERNGITVDQCGECRGIFLDEGELPRLQNLYERGIANGVQGLEMIGPERLHELERLAGAYVSYRRTTGTLPPASR